MISLASLNAILNLACKKLTYAEFFIQTYKLGRELFVQFIITITAILFTDTLKGIIIGMMFDIFFPLCYRHRNSIHLNTKPSSERACKIFCIQLAEEVPFFNKVSLLKVLNITPEKFKAIIY